MIPLSKRTDVRSKKECRSTRDLYYHDHPVRVIWNGRDFVGHLELKADTSGTKSDPILLRYDNTAAVTWISRFGGARDK